MTATDKCRHSPQQPTSPATTTGSHVASRKDRFSSHPNFSIVPMIQNPIPKRPDPKCIQSLLNSIIPYARHCPRPRPRRSPMSILSIARLQKIAHRRAQILEVHRFPDIAAEPGRHAFIQHILHHVRRQCDDWHPRTFVISLPSSYLAARLVSVFVWHVKIALRKR